MAVLLPYPHSHSWIGLQWHTNASHYPGAFNCPHLPQCTAAVLYGQIVPFHGAYTWVTMVLIGALSQHQAWAHWVAPTQFRGGAPDPSRMVGNYPFLITPLGRSGRVWWLFTLPHPLQASTTCSNSRANICSEIRWQRNLGLCTALSEQSIHIAEGGGFAHTVEWICSGERAEWTHSKMWRLLKLEIL